MYDNFGDGTFSQEMVIATLDYAGSHVSAILHQFTLIRILDCRKEDVYTYNGIRYAISSYSGVYYMSIVIE
jgi:hypothetical protein